MKVLHVISGLDPAAGGPTQALAGLASAQRTAGLDVTILTTVAADGDYMLVDSIRSRDVTVRVVPPGPGPLRRHPELQSAVDELVAESDVCHIHGLWEQIQHEAARTARRLGRPHLFRPCGMLDPWSLAQRRWKKRLYIAWRLRRNLDGCTAIHLTGEIERDSVKRLGFKAPTIVESNGVDLAEFASLPDPGSFRRRYPTIGDRLLVLYMGRLHYVKGLDILIPAFARIAAKEAVLVLAGPDDRGYLPRAKAIVSECRLEDRVIFTGMLRGADRLVALADADLFVLPSYHENFGVVVIEALAAGTPVVISDRVGIHPEITRAQVGGVVPTAVEPLATEIDRWLADGAMRRAAARRARPFAEEHYDWNEIARRWAHRYDKLASGRLPDDAEPPQGTTKPATRPGFAGHRCCI